MKTNQSRILRYSLALFGTVTLALVIWGQESNLAPNHTSLVTDWSHHHLIFSNPSDTREGLPDPAGSALLAAVAAAEYTGITARERRSEKRLAKRCGLRLTILGVEAAARGMHRDWSVSMGNLATVGQINYPAKYTFDTIHRELRE